jgi:flagellar motor protein MotB
MTSCRTIGICAPVRVLLIASGLTAGLSLGAVAETTAAGDSLLSPTPLILKDGRIANVSVHVVAFGQGGSALDAALAHQLSVLTDEVATDCFLTAQVIGHVGSSEVAGNDTLNAHRLARARADAVQASLIAGGLPAKAIASVWDWQFMVREARATLWVFRLTPGEDCEGAPLDSAAAPLVARAEPWPAPTQTPQVPAVGAAALAAEPARPEAPASPARLAAKPALAETARPVPPPVAALPAGPSPAPARVPSITRAATSPAEAQPPARAAETAPAETRTAAATPPAATPPAAKHAAAGPAEVKPAKTRTAAAAPPATERAEAKPAETRAAAAAPPATERADAKPAETRAAAAAPPATERAEAKPAEVEPAEVRAAAATPAAAESAEAKPTEAKRAESRPAAARPEAEIVPALADRPDPAAAAAAQPEPAQRRAAVDVKEERLVIVFPTNSSYFPPGTGSQLRSLLRTLTQDRRYEVVLESSVSGSPRVVGAETAEDAAKYNKWLATRRLERVRDWLDQNAADRALVVKPDYHANDESRQVVVRIRPTG